MTENVMGKVEWMPVFILPNLKIQEPIDQGYVALVPSDDERVVAIAAAHPRFGTFVAWPNTHPCFRP